MKWKDNNKIYQQFRTEVNHLVDFYSDDIEAGFEFVIEPQKKEIKLSILNEVEVIDESDLTDVSISLKNAHRLI